MTPSVGLFYVLLALIIVICPPKNLIGVTQLKRSFLYVITGLISLCWIWTDGVKIDDVTIPVLIWLGYYTASISWAENKITSVKDWLQNLAFVVVYFVVRDADVNVILLLLATIGPFGLLVALIVRRKIFPSNYAAKSKSHYGKFYAIFWSMKESTYLCPIGNSWGAGCVFAVGTLASVYVMNMFTISAVGLLFCNFLGLCVCQSHGPFIAVTAGCLTYVGRFVS